MSIFDITQTPWTELVKLETFLGLEPQLGRDNFYFNTSKVTHYSALLSIGLLRKCDPRLLIAQGFAPRLRVELCADQVSECEQGKSHIIYCLYLKEIFWK